jgi:hypothetical protein
MLNCAGTSRKGGGDRFHGGEFHAKPRQVHLIQIAGHPRTGNCDPDFRFPPLEVAETAAQRARGTIKWPMNRSRYW